MKRFVAIFAVMLFAGAIHAQGFPESQKQPKMKEQHRNQRHYKNLGRRHHISHHHDVGAPPKKM